LGVKAVGGEKLLVLKLPIVKELNFYVLLVLLLLLNGALGTWLPCLLFAETD
jgi:hypothetical protein